MNCIAAEVPKSACNATNTDFACICTNQPLNAAIGACLAQNCTVVESLQAQNYSKTSCGVPIRHNTEQAPVAWTLFGIAVVAVSARLLSKVSSLNPAFPFRLDDGAILAAMIALIASNIGSQTLIGLGLGKYIWSVPPENITQILLIFFAEELLYAFVVAATKLSILIFYLRLFNEPWFRVFCYVMLALTAMFGLGQMLVITFICTPISYNWTQWDGKHLGKCGDVTLMTFCNGGINLALDFILFVMPVTQFIKVSWATKKKIGVSLIFLVGLLVTASSSVRMATVAMFGHTNNPTYDFKQLSIWSLVEMHLSVICACMPGMTAFVRRIRPYVIHRSDPALHQQKPGNQPRPGRSIARRMRDTLARLTAPTATRNELGWDSSRATKSDITGTQPSIIDPEAPEFRDYLAYAQYAESGGEGTQLQTLNSRVGPRDSIEIRRQK
ncbi:hypothetical protein LX32DRAFT_132227 [Colletotrichum zoysiae]|uniref:CFEM domain-containing protein n=1 Tax=Colletotrichum zoysiae TaxID=1216348 RepID=A0AAD9H8U8_9PEZI|nr:hypothetical protein LX32DRAFT_132227 [Colletotrichum zoysiae]